MKRRHGLSHLQRRRSLRSFARLSSPPRRLLSTPIAWAPLASKARWSTTPTTAAAGLAYKPGGGSWAASSDARLKNIDGAYERGLDAIVRLNTVRFHPWVQLIAAIHRPRVRQAVIVHLRPHQAQRRDKAAAKTALAAGADPFRARRNLQRSGRRPLAPHDRSNVGALALDDPPRDQP